MAESGKGRLVGLAYPHDRFEHGIEGVEVLTREGVHVAAGKLKELEKVAEQHGVPLVKGEEVELRQEGQARPRRSRSRRTAGPTPTAPEPSGQQPDATPGAGS